jgi:uncharacterized phage protein (TIGR02218 family)
MKTMSVALKAHYASGTNTLARCWRAELMDGEVVTSTTADFDLTIDGVLYPSAQAYSPTDIASTSELSPDNLEVEGFLASPAITTSDIHSGRWDGADILLFEVNYNDVSMGKNVLRSGTLGEVRGGRTKFTAELRGLMQAYTKTIVRITTKECIADLGDANCKIDLAPLTFDATIGVVVGNRTLGLVGVAQPDDYFTGGLITFLSGENIGLSMEVKRHIAGAVELQEQMYFTIAPEDEVRIQAGCGKRLTEDCKNRYNNVPNFYGFPHVPGASIYRVGKNGTSDDETVTVDPDSGPPPEPPADGTFTGTVAPATAGAGSMTASVRGVFTGPVTGEVTGSTSGAGTFVGTATPTSATTSTVVGTTSGTVFGSVSGTLRPMTPDEIAALDVTPQVNAASFSNGQVTGGILTSTFAGNLVGDVDGYVVQVTGDHVTFSGTSVYNGNGTSTITATIDLVGSYAGFPGYASNPVGVEIQPAFAYKPVLWDGSNFITLAIGMSDAPGNGDQRSAISSGGIGGYSILPSFGLGDNPLMVYADGKYVGANIGNYFGVSTDLVTWTHSYVRSFPQHNMGGAPNLTGLAYVGGRFVALSEYLIIMESTDGLNWAETNSNLSMPGGTASMYLRDVAFDGTHYVVVGFATGATSFPIIYRGTDLTNMTRVEAPTTGPKDNLGGWGILTKLHYRSGVFIAVGSRLHVESTLLTMGQRSQTYILRSTDGGATWTDVSFYGSLIHAGDGYSSGVSGLVYFGGQYVGVGSHVDITSTDGITWTEHVHSGINRMNLVANGSVMICNEFDGDIVAPSYGNKIIYSTDGTTWTDAVNSVAL